MALIVPGLKQVTRPLEFASEVQQNAWEYGPSPMVMSGGWGSGKTYIACQKALYLSTKYRNNRGVIARHVGRDLRATTMSTFYKICPGALYSAKLGGRRSDQNGYCKLGEYGSDILFLHLDDPDSAGIIRGLEINWFVWDQAEENSEHGEELFDLLLGRLGRWDMAIVPPEEIAEHERIYHEPWPYVHPESGKPVPPAYAILAVNPDVETHWVYRRFHPESPEHYQDQGRDETTGTPIPSYAGQGYRMFHMPSQENRFLGQTNRQFLLRQDEAFKRRNVYGLWGQPEGAIHVIPKESELEGTPELVEYLRRSCTLFRTLDYGDSAPTCCIWWAVDKNGNCFAWQEYYMPNASISTHRGNITGLSVSSDHYVTNLADPSIFHKLPAKQGGRFSIADEYADVVDQPRETALFWKAADNNELGTRNRTNEYLRVDPDRIHPITRTLGAPRLYFVKRGPNHQQGVVHALQQARSQRRVKIGTNLGHPIFSDERDDTIVDHGYDNVRYFIASRPPAPREAPPNAAGTFEGIRRAMRKLKMAGRTR